MPMPLAGASGQRHRAAGPDPTPAEASGGAMIAVGGGLAFRRRPA
nr:hypothetical protein [uncultured Lichenicoccus sp.]